MKGIQEINDNFSFLWKFETLTKEEIQTRGVKFVSKYSVDVNSEIVAELWHLKNIYKENFEPNLAPFELLNSIVSKNLEILFPNVCIA